MKESEGVGDTVSKIIEAFKIDKLVKKTKSKPCGCQKRREYLNKKFPYSNTK